MALGLRETVLVPRFSRVLAVLVVAVCAVTEISLIVYGRLEPLARFTPAVLLVAVVSYTLFWAPRLRVGPAELEVVNPLRTHLVTWPALLDVDAKWSLTLTTVKGRVTVWAAPSPSPLGESGRFRPDPLNRAGGMQQKRPSGSVGTVAEDLIVRQWRDYRDRGLIASVEGEGMTTTWHTPLIAVLSALAALTLVGVLWP